MVNQVVQKIRRFKAPTNLFKPQLLYITVAAQLRKENQKNPLCSSVLITNFHLKKKTH
jgi:hypothetical protein